MTKHRCPICGDPGPFVLWIEAEPPPTCPEDPAWPRRLLHNICGMQARKAEQAVALRKITPDAFDANGNMIPGEGGRAWTNYMRAMPKKPIVL